jgi:hypothetical protein
MGQASETSLVSAERAGAVCVQTCVHVQVCTHTLHMCSQAQKAIFSEAVALPGLW